MGAARWHHGNVGPKAKPPGFPGGCRLESFGIGQFYTWGSVRHTGAQHGWPVLVKEVSQEHQPYFYRVIGSDKDFLGTVGDVFEQHLSGRVTGNGRLLNRGEHFLGVVVHVQVNAQNFTAEFVGGDSGCLHCIIIHHFLLF